MVDEEPKAGTDHHACNKFAGEPEASGVAGCSRRPILSRTIGRLRCSIARKPLAEPLESRGESGLIGVGLVALTVVARAVAHASDTRGFTVIAARTPAETARTILMGFCRVKKRKASPNPLNSR
jgi:hypothetical protein